MKKLVYLLLLLTPFFVFFVLGWVLMPTGLPRLVDGEYLVDMERVESDDGTHRLTLRYKTQAPGEKIDNGGSYTSHSVAIESKAGFTWQNLRIIPLDGVQGISPDAWVQQINNIDPDSKTATLKVGRPVKQPNGWISAKYQWCLVDVDTGKIIKTIRRAGRGDSLEGVGPNYWKNPNHGR